MKAEVLLPKTATPLKIYGVISYRVEAGTLVVISATSGDYFFASGAWHRCTVTKDTVHA